MMIMIAWYGYYNRSYIFLVLLFIMGYIVVLGESMVLNYVVIKKKTLNTEIVHSTFLSTSDGFDIVTFGFVWLYVDVEGT